MRATHAAAGHEVVADQFFVLHDSDEADVVGENVEVVHRRNDKRRFEFSRQIRFAVKRVNERLVERVVNLELVTVNPDGVISAGLRLQRIRHPQAIAIDFIARPGVSGCGRREDVAIHIAASREGGEQALINLFDHQAQVRLDDAVKLDGLAGGDPQRVVAVKPREFVEHAPLVGGHHAAGNAAANHHDVFPAGRRAQIAVVLWINTVKFQELAVVARERVGARVGQRGRDGARERGNRFLNLFVVRQLTWRCRIHIRTNQQNNRE